MTREGPDDPTRVVPGPCVPNPKERGQTPLSIPSRTPPGAAPTQHGQPFVPSPTQNPPTHEPLPGTGDSDRDSGRREKTGALVNGYNT